MGDTVIRVAWARRQHARLFTSGSLTYSGAADLAWFQIRLKCRRRLLVACGLGPNRPVDNMLPTMKLVIIALVAHAANGFNVARPTLMSRSSTQLYEDFGFSFAEQTYENMPDPLKGEAEYKQWVNRVSPNNMLNRKVCKSVTRQ
jgi:hypothetical protein